VSNKEQIGRLIASMKGLAGSGNILSEVVGKVGDVILSMDPGDFVQGQGNVTMSAPVATDLWYLFYHDNLLKKYHADDAGADFNHYDYSEYLDEVMSFLSALTGLKPLKVLTDLDKQLEIGISQSVFGKLYSAQYTNNGIYWINTIAFEVWKEGQGMQYASDGPDGYIPSGYAGYISFPVGQLGVMEVISLLQETELSGYPFDAVKNNELYRPRLAADITDDKKPKLQSEPEIFPDMKDGNGNALAGQNYCFGTHLIESAYIKRDARVELLSRKMEQYPETVEPKMWMRVWIKKTDTLPVPGEFIGILTRPVACPPHVWWFQESSPFLYAGNWMETNHFTSGVITDITLEADRTDGGTGNEYTVKVQGCSIIVEATDFYDYKVGDRVAILKLDSTASLAEESFTWLNQTHLKAADEGAEKANYLIVPCTFYKAIA
jgi:hypothetical protein